MSVEVTRLLIVLLLTAAGQRSALAISGSDLSGLLGATLGAAAGYVAGGVIGRRLSSSLGRIEEGQLPWSAAELISGGVFGFGCGLMGALAGVSGFAFLGLTWGAPVFAVATWLGLSLGSRIGLRRSSELWRLVGLHPAGLSSARRLGEAPAAGASLLDTSVVLDPRLSAIVKSGFLDGDLIVPRFVLEEIQGLADAQDPIRRRRGRRALDQLETLDRDPRVSLRIFDDDITEVAEVDAKLVILGRKLGLRLVTNDRPLARVAELQGVMCLNMARLAAEFRAPLVAGSMTKIEMVKEGSEPGQGVGYTPDGDMVVVSDAVDHIGDEIDVVVAHSVPTARGTVYFASIAPAGLTEGQPNGAFEPGRVPLPTHGESGRSRP